MIEKRINNYCLFIYNDKNELSANLSTFIEKQIQELTSLKNRFQFCICGGSTPRSVYKILSERDLPWEKVDIFLGDERCVDPKSEDSNTLMVKNSLLKNFGSKAFFYEIFSNCKIDEALAKQNLLKQLNKKCEGNPPVFDLTLLGLGDDGHTASLFPYQKNNNSNDFVIYSQGKGLKRVSLTPKILSASSKVVFLVSGPSKQIALSRLLDKEESTDRTPAKLIRPNSEIVVFCDLEASKYLSI